MQPANLANGHENIIEQNANKDNRNPRLRVAAFTEAVYTRDYHAPQNHDEHDH